MANIRIISNNKGCDKICFKGYMYNVKHQGKMTITWRCGKSSSTKCCGLLKTAIDMTNPQELKCHNHGSNEDVVVLVGV